MSSKPSEHRIVMAKDLAARWIEEVVKPEHRLTLYCVGKDAHKLPNLLRGFRDSKLRIGSMDPIPDLGISEGFDSITVWSSNKEALRKLASWFESRGHETTGIW